MKIYPDIKRIIRYNSKIRRSMARIAGKVDIRGLDFAEAHFVYGCTEKDGHLFSCGTQLDNKGLMDNAYYVSSHADAYKSKYFGKCYFKTTVPGIFAAVPFEM